MRQPSSQELHIMLAFLRASLTGGDIPGEIRDGLTDSALRNVYILSNRYDLAHLVSYVLYQNGLCDREKPVIQAFEKAQFGAVMRYERMAYECRHIEELFERENIPYIPLKGAVMRALYPEPWMRTSCDVDYLLRKEDLERAGSCLREMLRYQGVGRTPHDISYRSKGGVRVELHHSIIERRRAANADAVLSHIWDYATSRDDSCHYILQEEMFYFCHIAHMAKHFENGGCGVRPFMDVWLLNHKMPHDREKLDILLEKGGLTLFESACAQLAEVWFEDARFTETAKMLQTYIFSGGMYGDIENRVAVGQRKYGGSMQYIFHRLFLPYSELKGLYPVLEKHRWLLPVMEMRRWVKMIADGRMSVTMSEVRSLREAPENSGSVQELLELLGL